MTSTSNKLTVLLFLLMSFPVFLLSACQSNELSPEEIALQNAADTQVASLLFEKELDSHASYNVHKDGSVIIKFDRSVSSDKYTEVVEALRNNTEVKSVYAEQSGHQVCPLKSIR